MGQLKDVKELLNSSTHLSGPIIYNHSFTNLGVAEMRGISLITIFFSGDVLRRRYNLASN